jgi:hypothetical protein
VECVMGLLLRGRCQVFKGKAKTVSRPPPNSIEFPARRLHVRIHSDGEVLEVLAFYVQVV